MNNEVIGVVGAVASGILLLFTSHPVFFLTLVGCSMFYGWNLGKRKIPAEEHGA